MYDNFYITFSSSDANFKDYFTGTYYLPYEIILEGLYEIALDAFYSTNSFGNENFLTINCDLFPYFLLNNKAVNSCYIFYNKNVNEQIYKNHYYELQSDIIHSINISIQNLKLQNIAFDKTDFCVFKFHIRKIK